MSRFWGRRIWTAACSTQLHLRQRERQGCIQAANFVRTVEPARRPAGGSGWGRPDIW